MQNELNIGVIGAGRIGRLHAEHLSHRIPGARLRMVTDIDGSAARACAEHCRIEEWHKDYRNLLQHPDIQAVAICSSTDTHTPMIEEAAAVGKHIFCEKPIDFDLARIDQALAAVERAGVVLQLGFNRRFDANAARVRQAVEDGQIGTPRQLHIVSRDPAPPPIDYIKRSGGLFMDMTIHDFDMARFLIGDEVEEIYATGGVLVDPAIGEAGDLDTATILLKFANGVTGIIENSRQAAYGYDQRLEVFGSDGAIASNNNFPNTTVLSGTKSIQRDLPFHFFLDRYIESYLREMTEFVQAVASGGPSPVPGIEGRVPVVMGYAARRSVDENRPVRLSEIG